MKRSKRFEMLEARPVNQDGFVVEWPEVGLMAMGSPNDPKPSIKIENGKIIEMDGIPRAQFDFIDQFIADYAIDTSIADKAMAMADTEIAKMLVDVNVSRDELIKIVRGLTAAKIVAVLNTMNV
ncbi:MAG: Glycerol dehydratase, partial [Sporomusa sp.]|nr:Glycerol dehydratase [Sporomusa sp.]